MKFKYTEDDVQYALNDVKNGVLVRQVGIKWGVPRSTLQDRIYSYFFHLEGAQYFQKLS
jgi:hypothetical protein